MKCTERQRHHRPDDRQRPSASHILCFFGSTAAGRVSVTTGPVVAPFSLFSFGTSVGAS